MLIRKAIIAGALYAITVFLVGFVLGFFRVVVLVPWLGDTAAVILEVPVMLVASWFVCRACVDRLRVPPKVGVRSSMGAVAFLALIGAELALGAAFGRPLICRSFRPGAVNNTDVLEIYSLSVIRMMRRSDSIHVAEFWVCLHRVTP